MGKIIFRILSDFTSTQISLMKRENTLLSLYPTPAPINIVLKSKSLNGSPWILRYVKKVSHKMGRLEGWNSACVSVRTWIKIPKIHVMPDAVMGICRAGIAKPTVEEERSQSPGTYKQAILEYAIDSSLGLMPKHQMRPWSLNSDFASSETRVGIQNEESSDVLDMNISIVCGSRAGFRSSIKWSPRAGKS